MFNYKLVAAPKTVLKTVLLKTVLLGKNDFYGINSELIERVVIQYYFTIREKII